MHHELPERLDVEWYRKRARELLRAYHAADASACERVNDVVCVRSPVRLSDTQHVIAIEHGFARWADFKHWLETRSPEPPVGRIGRAPLSTYAQRAQQLVEEASTSEAIRRVRAQVPRLAEAFELIRAGDVDGLGRLLDADPDLARTQYKGAAATMLEAIAQPDVFGQHLGIELGVDRRMVELLIERGSELNTPLNLAACFNRAELVRMLLDAGANPRDTRSGA
ncbi:MAG TPA: hypothetical protein VGL99_23560 [Chloroflexota bacterium]